MSEEPDELSTLRTRVEQLNQELAEAKQKPSFWAISDWQDAVKVIGLPLAFVLSLFTLYDDVWLRWRGQDSASVAQVVDGLAQLQALDATTFSRQADGDVAGASAVDAAQRGQRERLVARAFDYWQHSPEFFQRGELDTLAHHLILQGRTGDAIAVLDALRLQARGTFDQADLWLKQGRAYAAEGDVFNLDAARVALDEAERTARKITARGTRNSAITNITFYRVYMELQNEQGCEHITPYMQVLDELSAEDTPAESDIDEQIAALRLVHKDRCGPL